MQDFHFQEDGADALIPISSTKHNEKPWVLYKNVSKLISFKNDLFDFWESRDQTVNILPCLQDS